MRVLNIVITAMLLLSGITLLFGEETPTWDFIYFLSKNVFPIFYLVYILNYVKSPYIIAGIMFYSGMSFFEVLVVLGVSYKSDQAVFGAWVYYSIILMFLLWQIYRKNRPSKGAKALIFSKYILTSILFVIWGIFRK